jgi:NADH:ubiquinone oxidoreductase subunit F (NADH-binding)
VIATRASASAPAGAGRLLAGVGSEPTLDRHHGLYGALPRPGRELVRLVTETPLRGRGGAGFPTGKKLAAVSGAETEPVVVVNGVEGEPASKKDRALLRVAPHLVLDGAELAADAVGAREVIVAVSSAAPELAAAVGERARRASGLIEIEVRRVGGGFVAGEETALLRALAGKPAKPTLKPPFPTTAGLRGAPTLVQNVETLAHVALIARFGSSWFGRGTALVTLGGAVRSPGVHEVPLGATLAETLERCGGTRGPVSAFLVGGYFGGWVPAAAIGEIELTPDRLGAGAIVALPASACAVAETSRVVQYLASESAGQCGPCVHGLTALAAGLAEPRHAGPRELERLGQLVEGRGACRHPDGVVRLVRSALAVFEDDYRAHGRGAGCGRRSAKVLPVPGSHR